MKKNKKRVPSSIKWPIPVLVVVAILVALLLTKNIMVNRTSSTEPGSNSSETDDNINYNPPTEEEMAAADSQKDKNVETETKRNDPNNLNKQSVNVVITDAGQYENVIEVRAFMLDHYQDGTCIITFRQNEKIVTKDTPAFRDASTTICTNPLFDRSDFPSPGIWELVVTYSSESAQGSSNKMEVAIN